MKKRILTIIATLTIAITPAMAQIYMDEDDWNNNRMRSDENSVGVMVAEQNIQIDQYVPLGEGVMLLAGLGFAYLLGKRKTNE